jgi:ubiquinone/menaquinone biosynthesis C-methylase UbiE
LEPRLLPGVRHSQYQYFDELLRQTKAPGKWLDLGCGHQFIPLWMIGTRDAAWNRESLIGMDCDLGSLVRNQDVSGRVGGVSSALPFGDGAFDVVSANMVVEHLEDPGTTLREVRRVLAPGGIFLFHTVNARSPFVRLRMLMPQGMKNRLAKLFEFREAEDVYPTHYRLNDKERIEHFAESAGLEVVSIRLAETVCTTAVLGPLALPELLVKKVLRQRWLTPWSDIVIAVLRRPKQSSAGATNMLARAS